jgi:hypothetical protein
MVVVLDVPHCNAAERGGFCGIRRQMFEEAESRRVFDAAAKNAVRGKSRQRCDQGAGWISLVLSFPSKKEHYNNKT